MIIPDFLGQGDSVGVVAPAKKVDKANTLAGIEILESWGLKVKLGAHVFSSHHQFAGTDVQRAEDVQGMLNDQALKAIFLVRGGYGTTRIIDKLDFTPLQLHPKWMCGFSDITALHLHLFKLGIASMHAPMPSFFHALDTASLQWFRKLIFGHRREVASEPHALNIPGQATGLLTGGNLSIVCHTIGTPSQIETEGNLLFIEDIGEQLYHLDRMMVQLKRAGLLQQLSGLIVGQFTEMKDGDDPFGKEAYEIILEHVSEFGYPVVFDFPIGHVSRNFAIPVGQNVDLEIDDHGAFLKIRQ